MYFTLHVDMTIIPLCQLRYDNFLHVSFRKIYGEERVEIERGKKEDRDGKALELKLSKFLDIYQDSDLYMVHTVPDSMKGKTVYTVFTLYFGTLKNDNFFAVPKLRIEKKKNLNSVTKYINAIHCISLLAF